MPAGAFVAAEHLIVFDGQSRNRLPAPPGAYPDFAMDGLETGYRNVSVDGYSFTALAVDAATRLHPKVKEATHVHLICQGGEGDIGYTGTADSAATAYADFKAYADAARGAGFETVTALTSPGSTFNDAPGDVVREAFNGLIMADAGNAFDHSINIDTGAMVWFSGSTYYSDGLHFSTLGAQTVAAMVAPTIVTLIA